MKKYNNGIKRKGTSRRIDITGQKFNRLTVISFCKEKMKWLCKCDCGNMTYVDGNKIRTGSTTSCGCRARETREQLAKANTTHGLYAKHSRLVNIYNAMQQRCYNKNCPAYEFYGGRGITMCDEWRNDRTKFFDWAMKSGFNENDKNLSIDRIDNSKGYSPDNCRWATPLQQANNTRNVTWYKTSKGTHSLSETARLFGIDFRLAYDRIKRGWDPEKAFSTPPRKGNYWRGGRKKNLHHCRQRSCPQQNPLVAGCDGDAPFERGHQCLIDCRYRSPNS